MFGQWIRGQLLLGLTVGVMTFAGLMFLSVTVDPIFGRYAVLLSIIAGILELLPVIGPIIAAVPAILLAATAGLEAVVAAFFLYLAVQQLENYLLVPKIQGDAVKLHPAVVLVRADHRWVARGAARCDPRPAGHGGRARRRALPVPPAQPARGGGLARGARA